MESTNTQLLFFGYSANTKDEADDDHHESRYQKHVIVFEDKERANACQHQQENNDEVLYLSLLLSQNTFVGVHFGW